LYNAKRLSTIVNRAKIGAAMLALTFSLVACGSNASTETIATDNTEVVADTVVVATDSVAVAQ
jgi:hypothetical protein